MIKTTLSRKFVANGRKWREVMAPKAWAPAAGQILVGRYAGVATATGEYGEYRKYFIKEESSGEVYYVSGSRADSLFAGQVENAQLIRLVFEGYEAAGEGRNRKQYRLFLED